MVSTAPHEIHAIEGSGGIPGKGEAFNNTRAVTQTVPALQLHEPATVSGDRDGIIAAIASVSNNRDGSICDELIVGTWRAGFTNQGQTSFGEITSDYPGTTVATDIGHDYYQCFDGV